MTDWNETKQALQLFAAFQEEPTWMTDLRLEWVEKYAELPDPTIEKVNFHRWPLTDQTIETTYGEEYYNAQQHQYGHDDNGRIVQYGKETLLEQ